LHERIGLYKDCVSGSAKYRGFRRGVQSLAGLNGMIFGVNVREPRGDGFIANLTDVLRDHGNGCESVFKRSDTVVCKVMVGTSSDT